MEVRRDTVWKPSKNGKSLRMRRVDNSKSWYGIHVTVVGGKRQQAARTEPFPSLLLLCGCERNIKYQLDQKRVLPSSDECQVQLMTES